MYKLSLCLNLYKINRYQSDLKKHLSTNQIYSLKNCS